jgi:hybrid polyketide synthase / nonribosomal peptide synthetase ACE1
MPLIELGMDSLVAVEIRTWFLQELAVDMPVLKILGGSSVADLVDDSMQKLPQELLSRFAPISAKGPPSATNIGAQSGDVALSQSSMTSASASDSGSMSDSESSSWDATGDLEKKFTEVGDVLNQESAKKNGEGSMVENATQK